MVRTVAVEAPAIAAQSAANRTVGDFEKVEAAYRLLLLLPHTSPVRARAQSALAHVRDLLASMTRNTPEEVQNAYEAERWS